MWTKMVHELNEIVGPMSVISLRTTCTKKRRLSETLDRRSIVILVFFAFVIRAARNNYSPCRFCAWLVLIVSARMAYMMQQVPVVTQPVVTQPVILTAPAAESKREGPNMGHKQNTYVWASDECGCCNDCNICE